MEPGRIQMNGGGSFALAKDPREQVADVPGRKMWSGVHVYPESTGRKPQKVSSHHGSCQGKESDWTRQGESR